jgi:hypothetical protein
VGPKEHPETSARNYYYLLRNKTQNSAVVICSAVEAFIYAKKTFVGEYGLDVTASGEEPLDGSGRKENQTLGLVAGNKLLTRLRSTSFSKIILLHGVRGMTVFSILFL